MKASIAHINAELEAVALESQGLGDYPLADLASTSDVLGGNGKAAQPEPSQEADGKAKASKPKDKKKLMTEALAARITKKDAFAQDAGGRLHRYSNGVYKTKGEEFVRQRTRALTEEAGVAWSKHLAAEVVEYIRVGSPELWDRPSDECINVANGLLRVSDRYLLPHTPIHLTTCQLPVKYDADAKCEALEAFVSDVFPPDAVDLAWQLAGWLMRPATSIQKAALHTGEGSNGKSTWLNVLVKFLGKRNVSGLSLHKLESNRFAPASLLGKLANVCPDLPSEHLAGTSQFKALTGGDLLHAEHKFGELFEFEPFARLVFSANHPPRSKDSSEAFFRRWLVVPFDNVFTPDGGKYIPREILDEMLTKPAELSGLLNRALDALEKLETLGDFSQPESVKLAFADFRAATDVFASWLETHTVDDSDAVTFRDNLRHSFNEYAEAKGLPVLSPTAFGKALKRARPNLGDIHTTRTRGGKQVRAYQGIGLLSERSEP